MKSCMNDRAIRWRAGVSGLLFLQAILVLAGCDRLPPQRAVADITVDTTAHYQTIEGWEAAVQAGQDLAGFPRWADTVLNLAVNDLGINRVRLDVRSGSESDHDYKQEFLDGTRKGAAWRCVRFATVNDNSDPHLINPAGFQWGEVDQKMDGVVLPMRRLLEARGERLFFNAVYGAFERTICPPGQYIHGDPEEYAEFVLALYLHLQQKYGVVPDTWEMILEPDNTLTWSHPRAIAAAVRATSRRLREAGFTPRFVAPSTTSMANAWRYLDTMVTVPGGLTDVVEISYHRYREREGAHLDSIARRATRLGLRTSMGEHIGSGYRDLYEDLTVANVSSWEQFTIAYPEKDNGAQYYQIKDPETETPRAVPGWRTPLLRQYFRYIRAGAVRVGAVSAAATMRPVAFQNANGMMVLVINADQEGQVRVVGLPAGDYGVTYATEDGRTGARTPEPLGPGTTLDARIPGRGALTIFEVVAK